MLKIQVKITDDAHAILQQETLENKHFYGEFVSRCILRAVRDSGYNFLDDIKHEQRTETGNSDASQAEV